MYEWNFCSYNIEYNVISNFTNFPMRFELSVITGDRIKCKIKILRYAYLDAYEQSWFTNHYQIQVVGEKLNLAMVFKPWLFVCIQICMFQDFYVGFNLVCSYHVILWRYCFFIKSFIYEIFNKSSRRRNNLRISVTLYIYDVLWWFKTSMNVEFFFCQLDKEDSKIKHWCLVNSMLHMWICWKDLIVMWSQLNIFINF